MLRGGVFTVGWFVDKFASDLRLRSLPLIPEELLEAAAAKVPPGSLGLMVVPYWNNVMNPYWDPLATGIAIGWTGAHGREHFYRAIHEGIAFEQRLGGDAIMMALGERFSEYAVMGGGSRSKLWCQIVADITDVPVVQSTTSEATCLGAGILAAAAVGWYPSIQDAARAMTRTASRFVLALGLNFQLGSTNVVNFATAASYGIAAYTSALLAVHYHVSFWLGIFTAGGWHHFSGSSSDSPV